jgi:hypothetical protein
VLIGGYPSPAVKYNTNEYNTMTVITHGCNTHGCNTHGCNTNEYNTARQMHRPLDTVGVELDAAIVEEAGEAVEVDSRAPATAARRRLKRSRASHP